MIIVLSRIAIRSGRISIPMAGRMTIRLSSISIPTEKRIAIRSERISIPMGERIVIRCGRIVTNIRLGRMYALEVPIRLKRIIIIPNRRILYTLKTYIRFRSTHTLKTYNHTLTAYVDNSMMRIRCGRMSQSHRLNPLTRMLFTRLDIDLSRREVSFAHGLYTLSL